MKKLLALLLTSFLLWGCTAKGGMTADSFVPGETDRLIIYTCLEESVYAPLVKEFEERSNIWVQVETGTALELMEKIRAGGSCDLLLGCEADFVEANTELFREYRSDRAAELSDYCPEGACWTPLSLRSVVIIYNPKLVRQNPPTDWDSLLSSAWRGEIAFADPAGSAFGCTALTVLMQQYDSMTPEKLVSSLRKNLDGLLSDTEEVVSRVADGSYCVAVVPEDAALRRIAEDMDLSIVYPSSGTWLTADCAAIPAECAHPENAEAFVDFALSRDAQSYAEAYHFRGSVLEELAVLPENPHFYDATAAGQTREDVLAVWSEVWEVAP